MLITALFAFSLEAYCVRDQPGPHFSQFRKHKRKVTYVFVDFPANRIYLFCDVVNFHIPRGSVYKRSKAKKAQVSKLRIFIFVEVFTEKNGK